VAAAAFAIAAYSTQLLRPVELLSVDARFSVRGQQERPDDIVLVQVDDRTFSELGVQWPFPRSLHGRVVDRLAAAGASTVAVDVQFTEPTVEREDNALIEAIARKGGVILSTTEADAHGESRIFGGEEVVHEIGARAASTGIRPDPGGTTRKMRYEIDGMVSFAVATAEAASGESIEPSEMEAGGEAWIDYRGPPGSFRQISYSRVLRGKVPASVFRGKTVIVGTSAPSLQDVHATSTSGDELMSGPELQANAVWTAEHGFPLSSSGTLVDLLLILLVAAGAGAAALRLRPLLGLVAALVLALAYALAVQLAFDAGLIAPLAYPLLALTICALGALAVNYLLNAFERQRIHLTFSRFVPEAVVEEVLDREGGDLRFGGVRRQSTVLFSDLRGFTTFSETLEPNLVIDVLNRYLGEMSDAIMDHGGTLVSYMGDGIMAVFGAPIEQKDHADRALAAAREMLELRLPRFNEWMLGEGFAEGFKMGVGLNSGIVMSGQVGSERRIEYTAIGDTTNTAARLEGMTKGSGHHLFIADATRQALRARDVDLELVGEREVRGRSNTITVWTLARRGPVARRGSGDDEQRGAEEKERVEGLVDGDAQP
jgi:adenylate cyclase